MLMSHPIHQQFMDLSLKVNDVRLIYGFVVGL